MLINGKEVLPIMPNDETNRRSKVSKNGA